MWSRTNIIWPWETFTLNSWDSRSWGGDFPRMSPGECFFVYWPITSRFEVGLSVNDTAMVSVGQSPNEATDVHKQVREFSTSSETFISAGRQNVTAEIASKGSPGGYRPPGALTAGVAKLEKTAGTWLKPYGNTDRPRENVKELLVAVIGDLGLSTFSPG